MVVMAALGALLLVPTAASATGDNLGGGPAVGTVSFNPGYSVPPLGAGCAQTSFNLNGTSEAFAMNTVGTEYAGPVTLQGYGGSTCEGASNGSGNLTLTNVQGTGPTQGTLNCANPTTGTTLSGTYLRVGTHVTATLSGSCYVNNFPAQINLAFEGEFVPTGGSGLAQPGVNEPISQATFAGAFTITPTSG